MELLVKHVRKCEAGLHHCGRWKGEGRGWEGRGRIKTLVTISTQKALQQLRLPPLPKPADLCILAHPSLQCLIDTGHTSVQSRWYGIHIDHSPPHKLLTQLLTCHSHRTGNSSLQSR